MVITSRVLAASEQPNALIPLIVSFHYTAHLQYTDYAWVYFFSNGSYSPCWAMATSSVP
jgi:hypothetical protein